MTLQNVWTSSWNNGTHIIYKNKGALWLILHVFCHLLIFLAHLSRRLLGDSSVHLSTFSNIFSSETIGPIDLEFHMETPKDGGTKVCSNGPGHMTKMAAMPIDAKNPLKIFIFRTRRPRPGDLVCSIRDVGPTKFVQMVVLAWPWPT